MTDGYVRSDGSGERNEVYEQRPKQLLFRAIDRRLSVRLEPLGATIHLSENIWKAYSECSTALRDDVYSVATRGISRNHLYGFAGSPMIRVDGSEWVEGRRTVDKGSHDDPVKRGSQ